MVPPEHGHLWTASLFFIAAEVVVRVGAPPAVNFGPVVASRAQAAAFQVNIGGTLSSTTDTSLAFSSDYLFRTWSMLQYWINTANRTEEVYDYQCTVAATEHWLEHCQALPRLQCGKELIPREQRPSMEECWQACTAAGESLCRAMEYDKLDFGCFGLPVQVFRECLPLLEYDRVLRWRRPIFATPTLERIYANITIWDDFGNLTYSKETYEWMLQSGEYDAYLGPGSPDFDPVIAETVHEYGKLLITHASNPLEDEPVRQLLNESHMPGGRRSTIALILVYYMNYSTGVRFDAPDPLEEGLEEQVLATFHDEFESRLLRVPRNIQVGSMSVTATSVFPGDDELPNYEYQVVFAVEGRKDQMLFLYRNGAFQALCTTVFEPVMGFDTGSPHYKPEERCVGPFDFRPQSFTVRARAKYYFQDSISMLYYMGARSVIFASGGNAQHDALCRKGYEYVQEQGLADVTAWYFRTNGSIQEETELVHLAMTENVDGLIGCGDFEQMVTFVWRLRAWNYNPKALVLLEASHLAFHNAAGQGSVVQVISPIAGELYSTAQSPIFQGTEETVFTLWSSWFESEPPSEFIPIAEAALAGIMRAYEIAQAKNATIASLQAAMLSQQWDNALGSIRWDLDGTLFFNWLYTAQMKPRAADYDDVQALCHRYLTLDVKVLNLEDVFRSWPYDIVYPLPTWIEREASIYPCEPGYLLNLSSFNFSLGTAYVNQESTCDFDCSPCPRGRSASSVSMTCNLCRVGFFAAEEGQPQCRVCHPDAMICTERGLDSVPQPDAGWYRFKENEDGLEATVDAYISYSTGGFLFVKCHPEGLCLAHNKCTGNNAGVMCEQCTEEYTSFNSLSGTCRACPPEEITLVYFCCSLLAYIVLAALIVQAFANVGDALYMSHSVSLRIFIDYVHLASAVFLASEFAVDIDGSTLSLVLTTLKAPVHTSILHHCILAHTGLQAYEVSTLAALLLVPMMLIINLVAGVLVAAVMRVLGPLFPEAQAEEDPRTLTGAGARRDSLGSEVAIADMALATNLLSKTSQKVVARTRGLARSFSREAESEANKGASKVWRRLKMPCRVIKNSFFSYDFLASLLRSSIVWVYILLPATIQLLLETLTCVGLDVYRLKADLNVVCNSPEHSKWFQTAAVLLLFYGLFLPLLLVVQLWRLQARHHHAETRMAYGFLYIGFKQKVFYFEAVHVIRKALVYTLAALPNLVVRNLSLMVAMFLFITLHGCVRPFDNRDFYVLERMQLIALVAVLSPACSTLLNHPEALEDTNQSWLRDTLKRLSWALVMGLNACVLLLFLKIMFRNLILKKWILLQECGRLGFVRRQLLRLFEGMRFPTVILNERTGFLYCAGLTAKERQFLVKSLKHTLVVYMDVFAKKVQQLKNDEGILHDEEAVFMPILLAVAIKRAVKMCVQQRQHKERLLVTKQSWLRRCLMRWGVVKSKDKLVISRESSTPIHPGLRERLHQTSRVGDLCKVQLTNENGDKDVGIQVTVEELQVALMNLEPRIREGQGKLHHLPKLVAPTGPPIEVKDIDDIHNSVSRPNLDSLAHNQQRPTMLASLESEDDGQTEVIWWPGDDASPREAASPTSLPSYPSWDGTAVRQTMMQPTNNKSSAEAIAVGHLEEQWCRQRYWTQPSTAANVVFLKLESTFDGTRDSHTLESLAEELLFWKMQEHAARKHLEELQEAMRSPGSLTDLYPSPAGNSVAHTPVKLDNHLPASAISFEDATKVTALAREYTLEGDGESGLVAEEDPTSAQSRTGYKWWQSLTLTAADFPTFWQAGAAAFGSPNGAASSSTQSPARPVPESAASPPPTITSQPQVSEADAPSGVLGNLSMFNGMFGSNDGGRPPTHTDTHPQPTAPREPPATDWLRDSVADNKTFPIQKRPSVQGDPHTGTQQASPSNPSLAQGDVENGWPQGMSSMFKMFSS